MGPSISAVILDICGQPRVLEAYNVLLVIALSATKVFAKHLNVSVKILTKRNLLYRVSNENL